VGETWTGLCVGGPYDGRATTHYAKVLVLHWMDDLNKILNAGKEDFETVEYKTGYYEFSDNGTWRWRT
jgi:hypothetical protein